MKGCKRVQVNNPLDPEEWECECKEAQNDEPCSENPVTRGMTQEDYDEFLEKCKNSQSYFWNNYIRKIPGNEHLPEYSEERWKEWQKMGEEMRIKPRRRC